MATTTAAPPQHPAAGAAAGHLPAPAPAAGTHGPVMAAYLLVNGIMAPAVLSLPYAFAKLSWAGGISINVVMALASWYCMFHQAQLFHYPAGARNSTYKRMGDAVLGPWGGRLISALQYIICVGSTITNMILSGQMLQNIYVDLCAESARCSLSRLGTSAWIGISGAISYIVYLSVPDMANLAWASLCGTLLAVYYSVGAMVVAGVNGSPGSVSHAAPDASVGAVFDACNAVGMLLFLYGITVLPEIQDVLAGDPSRGHSTSGQMIWAATAAHVIYVPLYLLVGSIGYWAFGSGVDAFLLFASSKPLWLVVSAQIAAVLQQQLVSQVMMLPVFEAAERVTLRRFPRARWLASREQLQLQQQLRELELKHQQQQQQQAAALPPSPCSLSPAGSVKPAAPHMVALADHLSDFGRSLSGPLSPHHLASSGLSFRRGGSRASLRGSSFRVADPAGGADCEQQAPAGTAHTAAAAAASDAPGALSKQDSVPHGAQPAVLVAPRHAASLLHMVASRTLITGVLLLFAAALPFFSSIMGVVGAIGFGPITYALPTILHMRAFRDKISVARYWFDVVFVAFWLLASLVAAIGAIYTIVGQASTYRFFS